MKKTNIDENALTTYILRNIESHPKEIVRQASMQFNISKQTVYRYIKKLVENQNLIIKGEGRNKSYKLNEIAHFFTFDLNQKDFDEEDVWRNFVKPSLPILSPKVNDICHYGVGEMVNNVIEHSEASKLDVVVRYDALRVEFWVHDNGIGIFTKIQKDFKLSDKNHAILELAKGKLTSDPANHSGEGIFFTSRMFDDFSILSEDIIFLHNNDDWLMPDRESHTQGTTVQMTIERGSKREMRDVFNQFTPGIDSEDFGFQKTIVPVKLLQYEGEALVSRSQAKRLLARFDQFKEIVLDFVGIVIIGQPFADEIFRVFQNNHPQTHLYPINTNEDIERMIKLVKTKEN